MDKTTWGTFILVSGLLLGFTATVLWGYRVPATPILVAIVGIVTGVLGFFITVCLYDVFRLKNQYSDFKRNWYARHHDLLTQLPETNYEPEFFAKMVVAGLKHNLTPSFKAELEHLIAEWYSERAVTFNDEIEDAFRSLFHITDRDVFGLIRLAFFGADKVLPADTFVTDLRQAVTKAKQLKVIGYQEPEEIANFLNRVFYHLPASEMCTDDGDVPIAAFVPAEEMYEYERSFELTGLTPILGLTIGVTVPEGIRNRHTQLVSTSGHGKTTALEYMIAKDLEDPTKAIIVIDSQGQMIPRLMALADVPPERYCILDAGDVEYPIALNPFAIAKQRLSVHDVREREKLTNTILELYDWVFSSIMDGSELTGKQGGLFGYVSRLLITVPDATIMDMVEILRNGTGNYTKYIKELSPSGQAFFATEFQDKDYARTKSEVLRRLFQLLQNDTFARMFLQKENKVDLVQEMAEGKLILINTSLDTLREAASRMFGRYMIALTQLAVEERMIIKDTPRGYLYVDEFQEYLSSNIAKLVEQSRKSNLGLVLSHQGLYQLDDSRVAGAIRGSTAIKMVGNLDAGEEGVMARSMRTEPEMLIQPQGTFFTAVTGVGKAPISFPEDYLSTLPQRSASEVFDLIDMNRARYAGTEPVSVTTNSDEDEDERSSTL